tara:strand:+ start:4713 stop:4949 length:237 start_codon:yes stop_codon:yes gene_type:complete
MADLSKSETELLMLRNVRNDLLTQSDWVVVNALEAGIAVPDEWKTYRQELRDITKKFSSMNEKDEKGNATGFKFPDKP